MIGAAFAAALAAVLALDARATRRTADIEAQRAAVQAAEDENARRLHELQGSQFATGTSLDQAKRRFETRVIRARGDLPRCKCAPGDPLCSEVPGETCAP